MTRRAARIDANHREIVDALRRIGASVESLAMVGRGCPDLLVGFQSRNTLLEIKKEAGPRGGQGGKLTADQALWHARWRGQIATVSTVEEALQAVMGRKR